MPQRQIKPFTVEVRRSRLARPTILGFQRTGRDLLDGFVAGKSHASDLSYEAAISAAGRAFESYEEEIGNTTAVKPETPDEPEKQRRILKNLSKEAEYTPEGLVRSMKEARIAERQRKRQEAAEAKARAPKPVEELQPDLLDMAPEPISVEPEPVPAPPKRTAPKKRPPVAVKPVEPTPPPAPVQATPRPAPRRHQPPVLLAGERWKRRLRWVK